MAVIYVSFCRHVHAKDCETTTRAQQTSNDSGSSDGKFSGLKKNASVRKVSVSLFAMLLPLLAMILT